MEPAGDTFASVQLLNATRQATRVVALAALGVVVFAVFAAAPGSPFQPVLPQGAGPGGPLTSLAELVRFDRLSGAWLVATGVAIAVFAVATFLALLREAWRGTISTRAAVLLAIGGNLIVLMLPLLFSRDVYSYAFYGRIAGVYHANPYVWTPVDFSHDALWPLVGPKWVDTPAVYGPLWTSISNVLARLIREPAQLVIAYRWIAVGASLATIAVIRDTARRLRPAKTAFAVVAFGANPVVLFHSVASGHNDLFVGLSVVSAIALLVRGRELPAVAVLSLGALVKATALVPLLLVLVWCVARRPPAERTRAAIARVGLSATIALVLALPYLQIHDPTLGMAELAGHEGWLASSLFLRRLVDTVSFGTLGWLARIAFPAALLLSIAGLARAVWRRGAGGRSVEIAAAVAWSLVLVMLLGPVLLPWYVTWALPLVWLLPRAPRVTLLAASAALALAQWSTEPLRYPGSFSVNLWFGHWIVTPVMTALLVWTVVELWRRLREGDALDDHEQIAQPAGQR